MKGVFLDTSGWFAALSPREAHHRAASASYRNMLEAGTPLVTTNLVVAEMCTLLMKFRGPKEGVRFLDALYQDPSHQVVFVDRAIERAAVDRWLRKFVDQSVSLTDAVSLEVMRNRQVGRALALDRHFELAGYQAEP